MGKISSAVSRRPRTTDVDDRQLVAERLARCGARRDDDARPGPQPVDRGSLVGEQPIDAARLHACDHFLVERLLQLGEPGDALGQDLFVDQAPVQLRFGRERVERRARVHRVRACP